MNIILASQSPRRKELLGLLQLPFTQRVAEIDETLDPTLSVADAVALLSRRKAEAVPHRQEDLVIAADTVVVLGDTVLGKPKDEEDAFCMLCKLSGNTHRVITGLTVLQGGRVISCAEETEVFSAACPPKKSRTISPPASLWTKPAVTESRATADCSWRKSAAIILMLWACRYAG